MVKLEQILVSVEGKLYLAKVDAPLDDYVLGVVAAVSENGRLQLIELPADVKLIPLKDL